MKNGSQLQRLKDVGAESSSKSAWIVGLFQAEKGWVDRFPLGQLLNEN